MLSPFAPQGSRATTAKKKKHNRKSPKDPAIFPVDIQAKPDVLPLSPSCSLLFQGPTSTPTSSSSSFLISIFLCLLFPFLLLSLCPSFSSPPSLGEDVSLSHSVCWVMEVTFLISSICALPWFGGLQQSALTSGPITELPNGAHGMPVITAY